MSLMEAEVFVFVKGERGQEEGEGGALDNKTVFINCGACGCGDYGDSYLWRLEPFFPT